VTPEPAAQVAGGAEQVTDTPAFDGPKGKSALVVEHLTKRFGDRVAFDDVSFEVGYGEVFGFLGPNGAGKTTTVRTLGTLIAPSSGSAIVAGIPVTAKNGPAIRARISLMPESPGSHLLVQLLFTPLLAGWSIWAGIAISARSADVRAAQQLGTLASLPPLGIVALMSFNVITPTLGLALGLAAALLIVDVLGWRAVAAMFDRDGSSPVPGAEPFTL
jgi:ABC transporter